MKVSVKAADIINTQTPALVVNLFKGVKQPTGATGTVDQALDGAISQLINDGEIKGSEGETTLVHSLGRIGPDRVVVVGLGPRKSSVSMWCAGCPERRSGSCAAGESPTR